MKTTDQASNVGRTPNSSDDLRGELAIDYAITNRFKQVNIYIFCMTE